MKKKFLFFLFFVSFLSFAQNDFCLEKKDWDGFQKDLHQIRKTILASHPNPFVYIGKSTWDSCYIDLIDYFEDSRTYFEFVLKTSEWIGLLKDSHVGFNFYDMLETQSGDNSWLVFSVTRINNKFYSSYFINEQIPRGHEIIKINSITIDSLFILSKQLALQEGDSFEAKEKYATSNLYLTYNLLFANKRESEKIPVQHINYQGDTLFTFIETKKPKEAKKIIKEIILSDKNEVTITHDTINKVSVLKINTFYTLNKNAFTQKIDRFFDSIQHLKNTKLLIDIRGNPGGYFSCADYLINYLDTTNIQRNKTFVSKRSSLDQFSNSNGFFTWLRLKYDQIFNYNKESINNIDFYRLPYGSLDTITESSQGNPLQKKNTYKGKCFLAIDGTSISASVYTASWFKTAKRGILIGEECMGPITGTCGNASTFYLKKTSFSIYTSTMRSYLQNFNLVKEPIKPDIEIKQDLTHLKNGKDSVYEYIKTH